MSFVRQRGAFRKAFVRVALVLALTGAGPTLTGHGPSRAVAESRPAPAARPRPAAPARVRPERTPSAREMLAGFDPRVHRVERGTPVADLDGGRKAILSVDAGLEAHLERMFRSYRVPYGAVVAIEPSTGRLLAYVSHSSAEADAGDLVLDPAPPAASVFKIVTGSALVEAGFGPDTSACFGGGLHGLTARDLVDDPARDRRCATLAEAMGSSINTVFAKLADRHLDRAALTRYASAFGFGEALPFDVPTRASPMEVPSERLEFARTAAGFWHMHMSPLHAALIAATIANGGMMPRPTIVDRIVDADGRVVHRSEPATYRRVVSAETARRVGRMMRRTITNGTARSAFFDEHGRPFLPGIDVAGKTGTLTREDPYRGYTWWVGFAPADHPRVAVAALVINSPEWRIKASFAAREALRYELVERPRAGRR